MHWENCLALYGEMCSSISGILQSNLQLFFSTRQTPLLNKVVQTINNKTEGGGHAFVWMSEAWDEHLVREENTWVPILVHERAVQVGLGCGKHCLKRCPVWELVWAG